MAERTGIAWTEATWNPVRGCTRVSEGCRHCYAERDAGRFSGPGMPYHGFVDPARAGSKWTGRVELVPSALELPLRWRRPRDIFANSMSDLFHPSLVDEAVAAVFGVMALAWWHRFQVLTKRPDRMLGWLSPGCELHPVTACVSTLYCDHPEISDTHPFDLERAIAVAERGWPLPNVQLGISAEDQAAADERIPLLQRCRAAIRFLSLEPLLGPIDLAPHLARGGIDWVIVGGESGPGARPMQREWAERLRDQCAAAGVPFFFKQIGSRGGAEHGWPLTYRGKGQNPADWPEDLRVQQRPPPPAAPNVRPSIPQQEVRPCP